MTMHRSSSASCRRRARRCCLILSILPTPRPRQRHTRRTRSRHHRGITCHRLQHHRHRLGINLVWHAHLQVSAMVSTRRYLLPPCRTPTTTTSEHSTRTITTHRTPTLAPTNVHVHKQLLLSAQPQRQPHVGRAAIDEQILKASRHNRSHRNHTTTILLLLMMVVAVVLLNTIS